MVFESDVEAKLVRGVEKLGGMCLKFRPDDHEGFPDRLVLLPGRRDIWVELKRPGGRLSAMQALQHRKLKRLGRDVTILWSAEEVDRWLADLGDTLRQPD